MPLCFMCQCNGSHLAPSEVELMVESIPVCAYVMPL